MMNYLKNNKNSITLLYNNNRICVYIIELDVLITFLTLRQLFRADVKKSELMHVKNKNIR